MNFVAAGYTLESIDWYHGGISEEECEKLLLLLNNICGTFCVRKSKSQVRAYTLSVLNISKQEGKHVMHYPVQTLENGDYYISRDYAQPDLVTLIEHHKQMPCGLCCTLTQPCPKVMPDHTRDTKDAWEVPRACLVMNKKLFNGEFSEVWHGVYNSNTKVAVKMLKEGELSTKDFLEEAAIMKKCQHERLLKLIGMCSEKEPICIISELQVNGSLLHYLRSSRSQKFQLDVLLGMMAQVAQGMAYLASRKYVHRDLAARNILVGKNNNLKIANFGRARILQDNVYQAPKGERVSIKWTAPEALIYDTYSTKSDVWSYGILMVEIITRGQEPYPGMTDAELRKKLVERLEDFKHPQPGDCPDALYQWMLKCWDRNPKDRPSFENLLATYDR